MVTNLGLGTEVSTHFTDPMTGVASGLAEPLCGPSSCGIFIWPQPIVPVSGVYLLCFCKNLSL